MSKRKGQQTSQPVNPYIGPHYVPLLGPPCVTRGWRLLVRGEDGQLYSPWQYSWRDKIGDGGPWRPGEWRRAECLLGRSHAAPDPGCECGYSLFRDRQAVLWAGPVYEDDYVALVEAAGDMVPHRYGWRAEWVRLVAAWPAPRWFGRIAPRLRRRRSRFPFAWLRR